tara:strand:- start:6130 stop:7665 length:1536 start_codon:yes stop_codon:yes gene_type:complete
MATKIVTNTFKFVSAKVFTESIAFANTAYYVLIGKTKAWTDENTPPALPNTIQQNEYEPYRTIHSFKKVLSTDWSFAVSRHDWTANTVYEEYLDTDATLYSNNYFVMTDQFQVYKCLFNNGGIASNTKPTGTSTAKFTAADGYIWKYMYTVSAADAAKYMTTNFIPVKRIGTTDDGSTQWDVEQASRDGSLDVLKITAGGAGYTAFDTGTVVAANSTNVTLASSANNTTDNIYNSYDLHVDSGKGAGQVRTIADYDSSTRKATMNVAFTTTPNTLSTYSVAPRVKLSGDGSGGVAVVRVNSTTFVIANGTVVNAGTGYTKVDSAILSNTNHGNSATGVIPIPPPGGHGNNAIRELGGYFVMINTQLDGNESDTFQVGNNYRVVGLVKNPIFANGTVTNSSSSNTVEQTTRLNITGASGSFTDDEFVVGATAGAIGRVVTSNSTVIRLEDYDGTFSISEVITGNTSGVSATISTITAGGFLKNSGDILYLENRRPITRANTQLEDVKLTIEF